jgi:hypothetical protein
MSKTLVVALLLVAIVLIVGHLEHRFAPTEQALRNEPKVGFIYPIPCSATLSQRGAGEQWQTRCYFTSSDKGKQ